MARSLIAEHRVAGHLFSYCHYLRKVCREYDPDIAIIHCPNPFVYPIAMNILPAHCKKILLWHSDILTKGILYKAIKPFETSALKKSDLILATSPNYIDRRVLYTGTATR